MDDQLEIVRTEIGIKGLTFRLDKKNQKGWIILREQAQSAESYAHKVTEGVSKYICYFLFIKMQCPVRQNSGQHLAE